MVGVFFRLKLRLIRNGFRVRRSQAVFFALGAFFAVQVSLVAFGLFAFSSREATARAAFPVIVFAGLFIGWVMVPALGYGLDETLDPSRLTLLPLSRYQLMAGLFTASATGLAPAATLIALTGTLVGYAAYGSGTAIVAIAVATQFALCLVGARAVTTALSGLLRRRRARDFWVIGLSLLALLLNGVFQSARFLGDRVGPEQALRIAEVVRWFPPGMLGRAVVDADAGRFGIAVLQLLPPLALLGLLGMWWAVTLERLTTTVEAAASAPPAADGDSIDRVPGSVALYPRIAMLLPRNRWGAVAAKDLRYLSREPVQRAQRLTTFMLALGAVIAVALFQQVRRPPTTLASSVFLWWFSLAAMTQFSMDRGAYWMNVVASGDPEDDLIGKNVVIGLLSLPLFLFLAVAFAAITGGWAYLPVALSTGIGALGVALGVGNVMSVRLAQPMPEAQTNLWAQTTGQGFRTAALMLLILVVSQLLVAPIAALVLVGLETWTPLLAIAAPASLAYGALLYAVGRRMAATWLREHQAELLLALSPRSA
jgi:ABC-2 type transport system permease protein